MTPKTQSTEVDKFHYNKIRKFCATNDTMKKMKSEPTEWEKMLVNHLSDNELLPEIYKKLNKK